jgi:hypothetical protein
MRASHNNRQPTQRLFILVIFCLASLLAACTNGARIALPSPTPFSCRMAQSEVDSIHSQIYALQDLLPEAPDKAGIVRQIHELEREEEQISLRCRTSDSPPPFNVCNVHCAAAFDLSSKSFDYNGFMLNPDWSGVVYTSTSKDQPDPEFYCDGFPESDGRIGLGRPPCTTQAVTFDPGTGARDDWCGLGAGFGLARPGSNIYHGHVNWTVATYTGNPTLGRAFKLGI